MKHKMPVEHLPRLQGKKASLNIVLSVAGSCIRDWCFYFPTVVRTTFRFILIS